MKKNLKTTEKFFSLQRNFKVERYNGFIRKRISFSKNNNSEYYDIGIINPSIGTSNLGDLIIYEAVIKELKAVYKNDLFN